MMPTYNRKTANDLSSIQNQGPDFNGNEKKKEIKFISAANARISDDLF